MLSPAVSLSVSPFQILLAAVSIGCCCSTDYLSSPESETLFFRSQSEHRSIAGQRWFLPPQAAAAGWIDKHCICFLATQMGNNSLTEVLMLSLWVFLGMSIQRRNAIGSELSSEPIEKTALSHMRSNVFSTCIYGSYPFHIPQLLQQARSSWCQKWAGQQCSYMNGKLLPQGDTATFWSSKALGSWVLVLVHYLWTIHMLK